MVELNGVEEVSGAEEVNIDVGTVLRRLPLNGHGDTKPARQSLWVKGELCLC